VEYKNKYDTIKRNHLKLMQKIPEQYTGKARNQETTENSHIGHCTNTSGSTNVKVQNVYRGK
jgi:hypothetical protein